MNGKIADNVTRHQLNDPTVTLAAAPGRVNLIGEHTDYTGGYVLPMGIPFWTHAMVESSTDSLYRFTSEMFPGAERVTMARDHSPRVEAWSDYSVGVLRELELIGYEPTPFSMRLRGNVPLGAGLSSSASVEVATAVALLSHIGIRLPLREIALLCQRAENRYVGSPCGIMDQFASAAAVKGHALLLHTRTLDYELLPMITGELATCRVVIVDSKVKHSITQGGLYEARRRAAEEGQAVVRSRFGVQDLGEASLYHLVACESEMTSEVFKRCHHIVSENARVMKAGAAMRRGDPVELGHAMLESHLSQRDDFECSVQEIDFLVEAAMNVSGCFGSRLTGGGFGGCTVSLVRLEAVAEFQSSLKEKYSKRFGVTPDSFVCEPSEGALAMHPEVVR